jgi:threonyl-tRNA synthetase
MNLFHMQEEAVGQVFWHPKGYALYRALEDYVRRRVGTAGYQEVKSPLLIDRKLWEMSGHWENYREHMFVAEVEDENLTLAVKPMNCPGHVQIFKQGMKSYRELPLRLAEFGRATVTSRPGHCTDCCACARSLRTMRISSARTGRSPPRRRRSAGCCCRCTAISASRTCA